jgi:hypothetical protein
MMKQYTKYAEGFKRTLVDEFLVEYRSSGLYASAFARRKGVNESTFLGWLETLDGDREYPRKLPGARKKAPRLVEIARSQPGAAPDQGVSIDWHGGTIRCAVGQLAHVLAAIKGAL